MTMRRFSLFISFLLFVSCSGRKQYTPEERNNNLIKEAEGLIHTGDIVFRCGRDITSYHIRELSEKDQTYSHAGIAYVTPQGVMIYHITSPDTDESRADTLVRLEPLERFARPGNNFEFGFGRFDLNQQQVDRMMNYLDSLRTAHVSFDYRFDLSSQHKMYCSEMVDCAIRAATHDSFALHRKILQDPKLIKKLSLYLGRNESTVQSQLYIPIDYIYLDWHFNMIVQYKFEQ